MSLFNWKRRSGTTQASGQDFDGHAPNKDQDLNKDVAVMLAMAGLAESRKTRRWNVFFRFLAFTYIGVAVVVTAPWRFIGGPDGPYTAVIDIKGVIAEDKEASADNLIPAIRAAFEDESVKGVVIRINSPGGSPVQSGYIYREIMRQRETHPDVPVYTVVTDMAASGGYYIAAAGQAIYADRSSVVGSIGVVMNGFGFVDAMDRLGVERRLFTAGDHKGFLDPFSPVNESQKAHVETVLKNIHDQFIEAVKGGRGDRLKESEELFSGLIWTGEQGLELGLVDGFKSASEVAREVIGAEQMVLVNRPPNLIDALVKQFGVHVEAAIEGLAEVRIR